MKKCNRCNEVKELPAFRKGSQCRACDKIVKRAWEAANREKHLSWKRRWCSANRAAHGDEMRRKEQAWRDANREAYRAKQSEAQRRRHRAAPEKYQGVWRKYTTGPNREKYLARRREINQKRRALARQYERERWHRDETYRLKCRLRWFLRQGTKGHIRAGKAIDILGCSIGDFRTYLESKFESGMSWGNYGVSQNGERRWEIDHIMPCAIFDLSKPEHQKRCFHFSNLQPLWSDLNRQKSKKILTPQMPLI